MDYTKLTREELTERSIELETKQQYGLTWERKSEMIPDHLLLGKLSDKLPEENLKVYKIQI